MRLRGFEQICLLLPVSGDPAFSTVGWQVVADQRKELRYTYTYIPPQVKSIHTVYLAQSFSRDALAGTLQGTLRKQCVVICTPVLLQEWALEHDLPKDKLERPMTRNQIKEHSKRVPPLGQRKRICRATRITQAEELVDDSVAADGNEEIATSTVLKQDVQGSHAGQENRAQAHEVRKVHRSANETAAERIHASLAIARVQSTGQQVSNAGDALQPTEKKELRQLLSSYRDRIVALEDAALKDAAIKEGLQTELQGIKEKEQAHLAKALQKAQQESQQVSAKLQEQLQEQTARADALQAALNGSQASAAAAQHAQPAASGELSQLHILLRAIILVKENPHLKQELLSAISP